jgi:hypothetical protein
MIEDIVFFGVQYYEIELDHLSILYPTVIVFGSYQTTDIIPVEKITIL